MSAFRLGLVGAGRMGRTHLRALAGLDDIVVVAGSDPVDAGRAALADAGIVAHAGLADMLAAGELDGVLIAAPTDIHPEVVAEVAAAGLPILCEKPGGYTLDDLERTAATLEATPVPLQYAFWRRFTPSLVELKARFDAGEFGALHLVSCQQWDGGPPAAAFRARSGGILRDMAVHEFDQARWLTGADLTVTAGAAPSHVDDPAVSGDVDAAHVLADLSTGGQLIASVGRYYPGGDMCRVEVVGTGGAASVVFIEPSTGDEPQLVALRAQARAFARYARGGANEGAGMADARAALAAALDGSRAIGLIDD